MIEYIYNPKPLYSDSLSGWAIDKWCIESDSGQGVAARRSYLTSKFGAAILASGNL